MIRSLKAQTWLVALMCAFLLLGPGLGAHLHLCFDGKEAPASFHAYDDGLHHVDAAVKAPHEDTDIKVSGSALAKGKFTWDPTLALVAAIVVFGLFLAPRQFVAPFLFQPALSKPVYLLPPLRGPPTLSL